MTSNDAVRQAGQDGYNRRGRSGASGEREARLREITRVLNLPDDDEEAVTDIREEGDLLNEALDIIAVMEINDELPDSVTELIRDLTRTDHSFGTGVTREEYVRRFEDRFGEESSLRAQGVVV